MVSICTPTFNRRPFFPTLFACFKNQTYPKQNMEWIIVDDGTDKIGDLVRDANIEQIRYYTLPQKLTLGKKRNFMHGLCKGDIIVYMDDDDYYPPERVSHAVETLLKNPSALCAGSSEIYVYFGDLEKMIQFGPYGPNHATAGTFAFRKELLAQTKYDDEKAIGEERDFLKNYTIPFVQLDPLKTILVFSHDHNTFDKRTMLVNPHPQFVRESNKTVDQFIRRLNETAIKRFFTDEIIGLLQQYDEGLPALKPDVLLQIEQINRDKEKFQQANGNIVLEIPGQPPVQLGPHQILEIIKTQQQTIAQLQQGGIVFSGSNNELVSLNHSQILEIMREHQLLKKELEKRDEIIRNLQKQLLQEKTTKTKPERIVKI
jgi:glycosyltransferase involved in cell wall biosynthesis